MKSGFLNYLTLFSSMSTLICCALPSLLVSIGLGAVMAGLASQVPGLIWMSANKNGLFLFSGVLLLINGLLILRNQNSPCPIDPKSRDACMSGRITSRYLYFLSVVIFLVGFLFAYLLPYLIL